MPDHQARLAAELVAVAREYMADNPGADYETLCNAFADAVGDAVRLVAEDRETEDAA